MREVRKNGERMEGDGTGRAKERAKEGGRRAEGGSEIGG